MNNMIQEKYAIIGLIDSFESSSFYLNHEQFNAINPDRQLMILDDLKNYLQNIEGIKYAWTHNDLQSTPFDKNSLESFYKEQLYDTRSGHIICMPQPYCIITNYATGASHNTAYDYDTHVPLFLYRKNYLENKTITQKVWLPQLAPTLAHLLNIARPSSSTYKFLPGVTNEK